MLERDLNKYTYINSMIVDKNGEGLQKELNLIYCVIKQYIEEFIPNENNKATKKNMFKTINNDKEVINYILEESKKVGIILEKNRF